VLPITKKLRLTFIGLLCSLTSTFILNALLGHFPKLGELPALFDSYFYMNFFAPFLDPHPSLIIIDSNRSQTQGWRREYAGLIDQLKEKQVRVLALDIVFADEDTVDPAGSQALVNSVAAHPNVILAMAFSQLGQKLEGNLLDEIKPLTLPRDFCEEHFLQILKAEGNVDLPFRRLREVARNLGHVNSSRQTYHFPLAMKHQGLCFASLPLQIASLYNAHPNRVSLAHASKGNGHWDNSFDFDSIPLDIYGQTPVNFIREERFSPNKYSWEGAWRLLQNNPEKFREAVVLVINSRPEDETESPWGSYPGWALLASVISQLLLDNNIDTSVFYLPALHSAVLCGAGMFLFLFVTPRLHKRWRKTRFVFIAGTAIFLLVIFSVLRLFEVWVGVMVPLLVYNASMLVVRQRYYQMTKTPQYENFGLAVLERTEKGYPIKIFEAPGGSEEGELFLNSGFLHERVFREALERIWALRASENDIKLVGSRLFDAVLPQGAFHILKSSLEQVQRSGKNLRLTLHLDSPELVRLPWELMRSSRLPPGRLVMNRHLSLVRYLPMSQPLQRKPYNVPLSILVAVSSPAGSQLLDIKGEKARIEKALRMMIWGGDVRLRFCEHATLDKLRVELEREPDVLHFIGHGDYAEKSDSSFLVFESEDGELDAVSAETLGEVLHDSSVRLVVLNSCESGAASPHNAFAGVAQKLVNIGVPAAVAMQFKVLDTTAQLFSEAFYSSLITNYSIETAVASARMIIMSGERDDLLGWATPVLYMRTKNGEIFNMEK